MDQLARTLRTECECWLRVQGYKPIATDGHGEVVI
jgi:hypothetical protein